MDVRALETLRAVGRQGGVTAAAAVLHLTPSAVSQQLAALSREMGVPLTERVGRGLRLTLARAACAAFADRPVGTVRVSAFQSAAHLLLPGLLDRVAGLDGVTVECSDEDVAQADFPALTDRVDVVIAHRPDDDAGWRDTGLRVVPLLREPLDVAVPAGHRLAGRAEVRPADLVDEDWIAVKVGFPVAQLLDAVAAGSGAQPHVAHRINDFGVVEALVAGGHGIALLPRYTAGRRPGVRLVPLAGVRAGRRIDALVRPDHAERLVVRRVLDELVDLAAGL
jgi:DNA-binding transcriptional LysR family regulator